MPDDRKLPPKENHRLGACWRATRKTYRTVNAATHHVLGLLLKLLIVAYFLFGTLVLVLRYLVLPNIDGYKPDIEQMASRVLGNPVTIAHIDASWQGLRPRLSLDRVVLHDATGKEALTLPHVAATLSWWTLMAGKLHLSQLEIDRPDLDISRDTDGRLYVAGIRIDNSEGNGLGPDWVLDQQEIVIRDGRLHWNDRKRGAPELALAHVNLVLRNDWLDHRFALTATPPAAFAAPLDVRAVFRHSRFGGRVSDPMRWKGTLYADLRDTDLAVWKAYVDYPIEVRQGKGSVRAWLNFNHAKVADFSADLQLSNVAARLRPDLPMLNLAAVSGRISLNEQFNPLLEDGVPTFGANGYAIALTDFSLRTEDGLYLPRTTISESFVPARNGHPEKTVVKARLLDLQTVANFAERLPLPEEQRKLLVNFAPRGMVSDFSAEWRGALPHPEAYSVKGAFSGLSISAREPRPARAKTAVSAAQPAQPGIPGFRNLTGSIDASERGGSLKLASSQLTLQLPGYLADPVVPVERLTMQADWSFQPNQRLQLDLRKLDFELEGAAGSFSGTHLMPLRRAPHQSPGTIDISGSLSRLDVAKVGRYLPLQIPAALRRWLSGALLGGSASDVSIRLKGDLAQFPFHKGKGEFKVSGRVKDGVLDYGADQPASDGKWPLIDHIDASIAFERARMEINAASARTSGVVLSQVKAVIPDLAVHDMMLDVNGEAAGTLQDFVRFTNSSPVAGWIDHFTAQTRASGNAGLALKLRLPLEHMRDARVQGSLKFADNNVVLRNALPPLLGAGGRLDFQENGFSLAGVRAAFLGGPVAVTGGSQRDGSILVKVDGNLTADGIRKAYPGVLGGASATRVIAGGTRYNASISIAGGHPKIIVESSLSGLKLDFPAPLGKAAADPLPLRFELSDLPSSSPGVERDQIRVSLGPAISALYERRKSAGSDDWQVLRGGIGVNVPAPEPDSGLIANVNMKSLDLDAWNRAIAALIPPTDAAGEQQRPADFAISQYVEPEVLAARAAELIVLGKKLDNVVVGASHQQRTWQANIDSRQASGYVTWNESRSGKGLGKVTARLASLVIPKSAASDVTDLLEGKNSTTQMPALDIVAEDFQLFGKKFGRLDLIAHNAHGFSGREWRISKLSIVNPDAELHGTGKWISRDGGNLSSLTYTLDIADAGRLLDRFGFANVLRGGKGRMQGEISWNGLPFSIDIPSLSGQFSLNIASGQFLKVDPSAAKLLGVLSLQSLPRRLVLDFRDVFSEGFAFDNVSATATIAQGVAKTDNFKMRGVAATALIDGSADIAKEEQDLHVVVIPEINVGAASVVYGLAVNPVIGVGTFLAQLFLRDPLMKAFTFEYRVTGPWKDPVVKRLPRPVAAPANNAADSAAKDGG